MIHSEFPFPLEYKFLCFFFFFFVLFFVLFFFCLLGLALLSSLFQQPITLSSSCTFLCLCLHRIASEYSPRFPLLGCRGLPSSLVKFAVVTSASAGTLSVLPSHDSCSISSWSSLPRSCIFCRSCSIFLLHFIRLQSSFFRPHTHNPFCCCRSYLFSLFLPSSIQCCLLSANLRARCRKGRFRLVETWQPQCNMA